MVLYIFSVNNVGFFFYFAKQDNFYEKYFFTDTNDTIKNNMVNIMYKFM